MEKIKVIFLDIDGVLRPVTGEGFNKKCIENLNSLVKETDAKIVISSTWRQRGIEDVQKFLFDNGVDYQIFDMTPIFDITSYWLPKQSRKIKASRGMEIQEWLRGYTNMDRYVESYVIIDDSEDIFLNQLGHYVRVEQTKGFDKRDLKKAIDILNTVGLPTI